jgi:hypothetical protein
LNFKSSNNTVKENFAFGNNLGFQAQIDDLGLKCCILGDDSKNTTSVEGRSQWLPVGDSVVHFF